MLSLVLCCIFSMAVEMVVNSWFGYDTDMLQVIIWFKSHGNKWLPKSVKVETTFTINFSSFTVAYCLVGLGFIFLLILMNIQMNKISFIIQNIHLFIFNTAPPAPQFFLGLHARGCCSTLSTPTSRGNASIVLICKSLWIKASAK